MARTISGPPHSFEKADTAMKLEGFLHFNIRCAEEDLPAMEKFYGDVLGLRAGSRPDFNFSGLWLYDGPDPIVHVSARFPRDSFVRDKHNSSVDHIAFKASGAAEFRNRLRALDVEFDEQNFASAGYQVFLYDPVGTKIEFNFLNEVVSDAVAPGTIADANMRYGTRRPAAKLGPPSDSVSTVQPLPAPHLSASLL